SDRRWWAGSIRWLKVRRTSVYKYHTHTNAADLILRDACRCMVGSWPANAECNWRADRA
ncbi:unnamed protein product, partial [Scytosiphon promiscuus]